MKTGFLIQWYHIFSNPFYFIRWRLHRVLETEAVGLSGDLLDFGAGTKPYESLFTNVSSYVGLDIEESGHSTENKKADVLYDGKTIPFGDSSFDNVFSSEVFEHVFNLEEILSEIHRILKPGGHLLISCPLVWPEHEAPYDFARYTSFGMRHMLEKKGYKVVRHHKTGHFLEVLVQQTIVYVFCLLPKGSTFLYYILHQIFILPLILVGKLFSLFPRVLKRQDFYHNNVLLLQKQ
jgi:SAM-dependent methyltransferase